MNVILLNGPARSGKSTAASILNAVIPDSEVIGFSFHLKRMVHGIYLGARGWDMEPDAFDAVKGEPQGLLDGMSWRQTYIHYSEKVIKPLHGEHWFGCQFVRAAKASGAETVIVPDSGFVEEAEVVAEAFGAKNVRLIRMHREGCTFAGDSRNWISLDHIGVPAHDVHNDGSLAELRTKLEHAIR